MPRYIFLDTCILQEFTSEKHVGTLSRFLRDGNYTIVITSLLMTELYNPGWHKAPERDRNARITSFLGQHRYVIVDNAKIFHKEICAFPSKLTQLPVELHSSLIAPHLRDSALLMQLRRHSEFVRGGKDIQDWDFHYSSIKTVWLDDAQRILDNAYTKGTLVKDENGNMIVDQDSKEAFLQSLDRRHLADFTPEEWEALGENIVNLVLGGTKHLPATRLISLAFWYAYVEQDKAYLMKRKGSDIGDLWHMSVLPYCTAYTTDNAMARLAKRVIPEIECHCTVFNRAEFEVQLRH